MARATLNRLGRRGIWWELKSSHLGQQDRHYCIRKHPTNWPGRKIISMHWETNTTGIILDIFQPTLVHSYAPFQFGGGVHFLSPALSALAHRNVGHDPMQSSFKKLIGFISNNPRLWRCCFCRACVELFALRQINRSSLLQFVDKKRGLVTSTGFLPFLCWNKQCCFCCRSEVNEFEFCPASAVGLVLYDGFSFVCSFVSVFVPCEEKADLFFCWDVMCISLNWGCIFEPLLYLRTYTYRSQLLFRSATSVCVIVIDAVLNQGACTPNGRINRS